MKFLCWCCRKPVSSDVLESVTIRAVLICPECIEEGKVIFKEDLEKLQQEVAAYGVRFGRLHNESAEDHAASIANILSQREAQLAQQAEEISNLHVLLDAHLSANQQHIEQLAQQTEEIARLKAER